MTTLATPLSWYTKFQPSNLSPSVQMIALELDNPTTPEGRIDNLVSVGTGLIPPKVDQSEMAEFFVHSGYAYARNKNWQNADMYFQKAIQLLPNRSHYEGVTLWMRGCVGWEMAPDGVSALRDWDEAIHAIRACEEIAIRNLRNDAAEWYAQQLLEMRATAACHSIEAYKWFAIVQNVELNEVDPGYFETVQQLWSAVNQKQTVKAWAFIRQIDQGCQLVADPAITPILLMECGLGAERLGNLEKAVEYFRSAVALFPPDKHWQAVTRWMLGCVLWRIKGMALQAQQEWVRALRVFEERMIAADQANDQALFEWYLDLLPVLRRAVKLAQNGAI